MTKGLKFCLVGKLLLLLANLKFRLNSCHLGLNSGTLTFGWKPLKLVIRKNVGSDPVCTGILMTI